MIGRLSQRKAVSRLSGVVSSPKLLARLTKIGQPAYSGTVPAGCFWLRCGATGRGNYSGYDEGYSYYPGAGGAYAYNELPVTPGQAVSISSTMDTDIIIKIGDVVVCKAAGATQSNYTRIGGDPANCIGLYARRGGSYGQAGEAGGAGTGYYGSSGPGGDSDKMDGIGIWGLPGSNGAGPGAGGTTQNSSSYQPPGPGAAVLEYWSGKR